MSADTGIAVKGVGVGTATTASGTSQATGSTFYIWAVWDSFASFTSVSDNKGNSYTQLGSEITSGSLKVRLYECVNGVGGASHTASFVVSGGGQPTVFLVECTGVATTSPRDQSGGRADNSSPYTLAAGLTLGSAPQLILAFLAGDSGSNPATHAEGGLGSSTIVVQETNGTANWVAACAKSYKASTGTFNPSWTESGASNTVVWMVTLKEPAGGGSSKTGTGAITSSTATASGTAVRRVHGSGTVTSSKATAAGSATKNNVAGHKTGTGTPNSPKATTTGTAVRKVNYLGGLVTLSSPVATMAGTGTTASHEGAVGSGDLASPKATVAGTATLHRHLTGSGAINLARIALVAGTAVRHSRGSGALTGPKATVSGFSSAPASGNSSGMRTKGRTARRTVRCAHGGRYG